MDFVKALVVCCVVNVCWGIQGPLTPHFQNWLNRNGYGADDFEYVKYGTQGSFGGKQTDSDKIAHPPVIFIHGNSDSALNTTPIATGWGASIEYFLENDYSTGELYAISWGDNNEMDASMRTHDCRTLMRLRRFVRAILDYTKANKISIVSHSMGVTLARKLIQGGTLEDGHSECSLGASLNARVDVLVGISGGNYGLCSCEGAVQAYAKTCSDKNGFFPGNSCGMNYLLCTSNPLPMPCDNKNIDYSSFLQNLNNGASFREANYVFSMWSKEDDLIGFQTSTWGRSTCLIPYSTGKVILTGFTHMESKDRTYQHQYIMITQRKIPKYTEFEKEFESQNLF